MSIDTNSLAHSTWNCKYHIVFAPKYRRKVFYGQKRKEIGAILRRLCEFKQVKIIEAEVCPDHVHMLVEIPPKLSVAGFMGYLKGKSTVLIYQQFTNLFLKYRHREFWYTGYRYGDRCCVPRNTFCNTQAPHPLVMVSDGWRTLMAWQKRPSHETFSLSFILNLPIRLWLA